MSQPGVKRPFRWAAVGLTACVLHVLLAPWTAQKTQTLWQEASDWKAQRDSARYIEKLRNMPEVPMDRFLACATAFRDHLQERGIKLTILLWPENPTLLAKDGVPQLEPKPLGAVLFQAAKALRARQIKVMEILPTIHDQLCHHPADAAEHHPDSHLGEALENRMVQIIYAGLNPDILVRNGRGILFAGECYAYTIATALQKHAELSETHAFWRNAMSNLIPYEMAPLPEEELKGIHQLIWMVPGRYILGSDRPGIFPPFENALAQQGKTIPGTRTVHADLTEAAPVSDALGKNSPYPDALRECQFRSAEGEEFLGLIQVMEKREVDMVVKTWSPGQPMLLTLAPWDEAKKSHPGLEHEQILGDVPNFTLPRYYILRWLNAP